MVLTRINTAWLIGIILLLAIFRMVPHPPNATPIAAMALFAGSMFSNRFLAYVAPLLAMLLSDILIGFHTTILYVYISFVITVFMGSKLNRISIIRLGCLIIFASILFFLITNFGVWLHNNMYPQNLSGLLQAYIAGLPFLRNSIVANIIFVFIAFYGLIWIETKLNSTKGAQKIV